MTPVDAPSRAWARHELDEVHAGIQDLEGWLHEEDPERKPDLYAEIVAHVDRSRESLRRAEEVLRRADQEAKE